MSIKMYIISFIIGSGLIIAAICFIVEHGRSQDRTLSGRLYPSRTPRSGDPGTRPAPGPVDRYRPS